MKNTSKTLTLTTKTARPDSAQLALPKNTIVHVLDNAEAPNKVTVVTKTRSRLLTTAAQATETEVAAPSDKHLSAAAAIPVPATLNAPTTKILKREQAKTVVMSTKIAAQTEVKAEASVLDGPAVNQTTDAATLAAIDTSGYFLPTVKVQGRRGRKPKEFQPENDEIAALNAVERSELKSVDKAKAKDRKAKEKSLLKDAFSSDSDATEEDLEQRRQKLMALIKFGKERGFLTNAEINDHLPENIFEPEAIEGIISTFNDMGIAVYEQ